ncbi:MAG: hypothetical protein QNJ38_10890 [Prochloraceae cyanobacterium]|nr:hypothetical protein [Prochloraceae cyanobacterium]
MADNKISKYALIFKKVNADYRFNYSQRQICKFSGLQTSLLSRFLNGYSDISVVKFFELIQSMPEDFQKEYWRELGLFSVFCDKQNIDWEVIIGNADKEDIAKILGALGNRWSEIVIEADSKNKALA